MIQNEGNKDRKYGKLGKHYIYTLLLSYYLVNNIHGFWLVMSIVQAQDTHKF